VCHFVDTAGFLIGSRPVSVRAWAADGHRDPVLTQSVTAALEYADGSTAAIIYSGVTSPGAPKELIEVAAEGLAARMDDFRSLRVWGSKRRSRKYRGMPKGHEQEMEALVKLVKGTPTPTGNFRLALWSSLATVCLARSLSSGESTPIDPDLPALRAALDPARAADIEPSTRS